MLRALRIVLAGLAVLALGTFVVLAVLRAGHPYELEWQEGGVLAHVERLARGAPLYAAPSLDYIAFPYPPLYYAFAAGARAVLGPGFLAPRVVSIAASLVAFFLLHRIVARRTGSAFAGLCAAGLFAACYRFAGAWLDVARVDALSIALTLAGVEIVLARRGVLAAAAAERCSRSRSSRSRARSRPPPCASRASRCARAATRSSRRACSPCRSPRRRSCSTRARTAGTAGSCSESSRARRRRRARVRLRARDARRVRAAPRARRRRRGEA